MRRADRLFEIIQQLRGDRLVTAQALAEKLEVSVRTIYRDIRDLQASGVPIDGAAGVGYLLRPGYQLPPLMFLPAEIEALIVGARMVKAWAGKSIAAAAAEALIKIGAVVPEERMRAASACRSSRRARACRIRERDHLDAFGKAIDGRLKVRFGYRDAEGLASRRTVRPLALQFWGQVWTLAAWCELREDFRTFRVDRVERLEIAEERFQREAGRTLEDYLARITRAP